MIGRAGDGGPRKLDRQPGHPHASGDRSHEPHGSGTPGGPGL